MFFIITYLWIFQWPWYFGHQKLIRFWLGIRLSDTIPIILLCKIRYLVKYIWFRHVVSQTKQNSIDLGVDKNYQFSSTLVQSTFSTYSTSYKYILCSIKNQWIFLLLITVIHAWSDQLLMSKGSGTIIVKKMQCSFVINMVTYHQPLALRPPPFPPAPAAIAAAITIVKKWIHSKLCNTSNVWSVTQCVNNLYNLGQINVIWILVSYAIWTLVF